MNYWGDSTPLSSPELHFFSKTHSEQRLDLGSLASPRSLDHLPTPATLEEILLFIKKEMTSNRLANEAFVKAHSDSVAHEVDVLRHRLQTVEHKCEETAQWQQDWGVRQERLETLRTKEAAKFHRQLQSVATTEDLTALEQSLRHSHLDQVTRVELQVKDIERSFDDLKLEVNREIDRTVQYTMRKLVSLKDLDQVYKRMVADADARMESFAHTIQAAIDSLLTESHASYNALETELKELQDYMLRRHPRSVRSASDPVHSVKQEVATQGQDLVRLESNFQELSTRITHSQSALFAKLQHIEVTVAQLQREPVSVIENTEFSDPGIFREEEVSELEVDEDELKAMVDAVVSDFIEEETNIGAQLVKAVAARVDAAA